MFVDMMRMIAVCTLLLMTWLKNSFGDIKSMPKRPSASFHSVRFFGSVSIIYNEYLFCIPQFVIIIIS